MAAIIWGRDEYLRKLMELRGPVVEHLQNVTKFECSLGHMGLHIGNSSYDIALLPSVSIKGDQPNTVYTPALMYLATMSDTGIVPVFFGTNKHRNKIMQRSDLSFLDMSGNFCLPMYGMRGYHKSMGCERKGMPTAAIQLSTGMCRRIIDYMRGMAGDARAKDIVAACGENCAVHRALVKLERAGVVVNYSWGRYALSRDFRGFSTATTKPGA